jgi:hypothetical protein
LLLFQDKLARNRRQFLKHRVKLAIITAGRVFIEHITPHAVVPKIILDSTQVLQEPLLDPECVLYFSTLTEQNSEVYSSTVLTNR